MRAAIRWTEDRIATLQSMWADGATAAAIADRLGGLSRSAVLGKILRLRRRAAAATAKKRRSEAKSLSTPAALVRRRPVRDDTPPPPSPPPPPKPRRKEQPQPRRGISLLELTNETCRFPYGQPGRPGFFFCGAPGADLARGRPYCARHARRAYSGAANSEGDDSPVIPVASSPSIAPCDSPRRDIWRAPASRSARSR